MTAALSWVLAAAFAVTAAPAPDAAAAPRFAGATTACTAATGEWHGQPAWPPQHAPVAAVTITVDGLGWTNPGVLRRALDTRPGLPFDAARLNRDLQRLRDYEIFRAVTATAGESPAGATIRINVTDRWGIVPVFRPLSGGDIYSLKVGVRDTNFLGRNQDAAIYGGVYKSPISADWLAGVQWYVREFAGRNSLYLEWARDYGIDPFYGGATIATAVQAVANGGSAEFTSGRSDVWQPGAYLSVEESRYATLRGGLAAGLPETTVGIRPGVLFRAGRIRYDRYRYEGVEGVAAGFREFRPRGAPGFWGGSLRGRLFLLPQDRINLALQVLVEVRNSRHPLDDLGYGGLTRIRGYPHRFLRGRSAAAANAEVRIVAADALWRTFFIEFVGFYDAAVVDDAAAAPGRTQTGQSVGLGLRGAIVQIYGVYLRLDVATSVARGDLGPDIGLGISQFF